MSKLDTVFSDIKMFEGAEVVGVDDSNHTDIDLSQIVFFDSESDFSSPGQENDHDMESAQDNNSNLEMGSFKIKQEKELIIIDEAPMICNDYQQSNNERDVPRISADIADDLNQTLMNDCPEEPEEEEPEAEEEKSEVLSISAGSLVDHQYSIPQSLLFKETIPYDEVIRNIIDTSKSDANNNTIELLLNFVDVMQNSSNDVNSEFLDSIKFALQSRKNNMNASVNDDQQVASTSSTTRSTTGNRFEANSERASLISNAQNVGKKYLEKLDDLNARKIEETNEDKLSFEKDLRSCLKETRKELASLAYEMKQKQQLMNFSSERISDLSASSSFSGSESDSSTLSRIRRKKFSKRRQNSSLNSNENEIKAPKTPKDRPSVQDEDIERLLAFDNLEAKRTLPQTDKSKQSDAQDTNKVKTKKRSDKANGGDYLGSSSEGDSSDISSNAEVKDTSDEEDEMLKRQENAIKEGLLADSDFSDSSSSSENIQDFLKSSDEEDPRNENNEPEVPTPQSPPVEPVLMKSPEKSNIETVESPKHSSPINETVKAEESSDDDKSDRVPKKRVRRTSAEREVFDKNLLDGNKYESNSKVKSSKSSKIIPTAGVETNKTESKCSPVKATENVPELGVDVSMFNSARNRKNSGPDFDLEKCKKHEEKEIKPTTSTSVSKLSAMIIDDDECISLSSETDSEVNAPIDEKTNKKFPKRKKFISEAELQEETKKARKMEKDRLERLKRKVENMSQSMSMSQYVSQDPEDPLILDLDKDGNAIEVHQNLASKMKDHQKEGVKFLYDSCFGSLKDEVKTESGCILAHSMGLGKTLQLISLVHVLITHEKLNTKKVLVVCPKSTIINWKEEFEFWLGNIPSKGLKISYIPDDKSIFDRVKDIEAWYDSDRPSVFLINYESFRYLAHFKGNRATVALPPEQVERIQATIKKCFLSPGPDLVVCDEGHLIKNQNGATNRAVSKISTRRRIILTGTPLQNNLNEYYAMVNWIKPGILGTNKEFNNIYANPIKDGQHEDSTPSMIKRMKQRSLVLHKNLSAFVQRKESSVLEEYLPKKYEYCIFVPLTEKQEDLYKYFLEVSKKDKGKSLLNDYTALRKIWTHPRALKNARERALAGQVKESDSKQKRSKYQDDDGNEEPSDDILDKFEGDVGVKSLWFERFVNEHDLNSIFSSNKLFLLFQILHACQERQEKVLIFSAFVAILNIVEDFMKLIHKSKQNQNSHESEKYGYNVFSSEWVEYHDYIRLDGSTKRDDRQRMIKAFNNENNKRLRCFLISAKAGGQGINLTGANRCIILDTSWNPSSDQQNIFRIYRLGQKKPCYAYRFIAMGTMEEKVYSRSVTKQAMSGRVVDKRQIDRHYKMEELTELYEYYPPDFSKRPQFDPPDDVVLKSLLYRFAKKIYKYHSHDSLLVDKPEQGLTEQEKDEAWENYQQEISHSKAQNTTVNNHPNQIGPLISAHGFDYSAIAASMFTNPLFASLQYPTMSELSLLNSLIPPTPNTFIMDDPYLGHMSHIFSRGKLEKSVASQKSSETLNSRKRSSIDTSSSGSKGGKSSSELMPTVPKSSMSVNRFTGDYQRTSSKIPGTSGFQKNIEKTKAIVNIPNKSSLNNLTDRILSRRPVTPNQTIPRSNPVAKDIVKLNQTIPRPNPVAKDIVKLNPATITSNRLVSNSLNQTSRPVVVPSAVSSLATATAIRKAPAPSIALPNPLKSTSLTISAISPQKGPINGNKSVATTSSHGNLANSMIRYREPVKNPIKSNASLTKLQSLNSCQRTQNVQIGPKSSMHMKLPPPPSSTSISNFKLNPSTSASHFKPIVNPRPRPSEPFVPIISKEVTGFRQSLPAPKIPGIIKRPAQAPPSAPASKKFKDFQPTQQSQKTNSQMSSTVISTLKKAIAGRLEKK